MNKQKIFLSIAFLMIGIFLGTFIMGCFYISKETEYEAEYKELQMLRNYENDLYEEKLDFYDDLNDMLYAENYELKDKLEKLENSKYEHQTQELNESYKECLTKVMNEYESQSKLKYGVHQVSTIYQADDVIYQFIIFIYDDTFSFIDTWNCFSVYKKAELMYVDCDMVK